MRICCFYNAAYNLLFSVRTSATNIASGGHRHKDGATPQSGQDVGQDVESREEKLQDGSSKADAVLESKRLHYSDERLQDGSNKANFCEAINYI